jgi:hypothetical protein
MTNKQIELNLTNGLIITKYEQNIIKIQFYNVLITISPTIFTYEDSIIILSKTIKKPPIDFKPIINTIIENDVEYLSNIKTDEKLLSWFLKHFICFLKHE